MSKRSDGRNEEILEPALAIIDSHQHLFVRPQLRYLLDDYLEDAHAGHRVVASVYVETQYGAYTHGPELLRPLGEIEFARDVGAVCDATTHAHCRVAAAIIGHADIGAGAAVGAMLDQAVELTAGRLRGIRQIAMDHSDPRALRFLGKPPKAGLLRSPEFHQGLRQLVQRDLCFEATVFGHQLQDLAGVADRHPDLTIVLSHMGLPLLMDLSSLQREECIQAWRQGMELLAMRTNVLCKVGGLGTAYWGFGFGERDTPTGFLELAQAWQPFIEIAIDAFGVQRCMMESDYPADARSCGFVPLWNALKHSVRSCTTKEKAALFHANASAFYRIPV